MGAPDPTPGTTRLSTIDTAGHRLWVYPADVSGRFRRRRHAVSASLVLFFLGLPWVRVGGHQAVLLDLWNGKFSFFGLRFWFHDAPILLFLAGGAAVLLAFVTAVWGRVWCGWACPQTVFIDSVFRRIERWAEGDGVRRRRLDESPWNASKASKKGLKWGLYGLVSLVLSHSFLAYFVGTDSLAKMMRESPAQNPGVFAAMAVMAAAVLFDFGWLREQFCTLICPYGRFQSVLMDERSWAVAYDPARGEPRRKGGDCIDCGKCVHVCPTGIDIRNGLQLECIACTACIDACDSVMAKTGKPPGLIRYSSERRRDWREWVRPAAYVAVLALLGGGLAWVIASRSPVEVTLIRKVGSPYEEILRPGLPREVVNAFKLDLLNQTFDSVKVIRAEDPRLAQDGVSFVSPALPAELAAGESRRVDLFVRFPVSRVREGRGRTRIRIVAESSGKTQPVFVKDQEVPLVGPLR